MRWVSTFQHFMSAKERALRSEPATRWQAMAATQMFGLSNHMREKGSAQHSKHSQLASVTNAYAVDFFLPSFLASALLFAATAWSDTALLRARSAFRRWMASISARLVL